ncbi:MAG: hypothetical protein OJJ54_00505 [Pseudonocardia sp.]|nr:hypothetical protein [Pseudonocardia sp.]
MTSTSVDKASGEDDLELLRAYEPVVRYTEGELFLPIAVEPYVAQCSLWSEGETPLVAAGELTLDDLCEAGLRYRDQPLYLRFVQAPMRARELNRWRKEERSRLRGTARFATVGVIARLIDALLRISLLVRGKVPGGLVAAAERTTREHLATENCPYYGRVVREGGYTVLQYWYFYACNNWRSTFHGVNDHEADWEMVSVYLAPGPAQGDGDGDEHPAWVAFSSHDHTGDDLRRRWDDPDLQREGDHPVVFAGAGSHSGAFIAGDYVVSVELPALRRIIDLLERGRRRLAPWAPEPGTGGFGIPYVDYARGDGHVVGPGHPRTWSPVLVDDDTPWVRDFRGLWGLDTRDTFGGERAPAGPRYERSGAVRASWADPLGWAGLQKVSPTADEERAALAERIKDLTDRLAELDRTIETDRDTLRGLHAQARSLKAREDTRELGRERAAEVERCQRELAETTAERARLAEERAAHREFLDDPGPPLAPDAHVRHKPVPHVVAQDRRTSLLRVWAAISAPLLILASGVVVTRPSPVLLLGFAIFLAVFVGVEAVLRRRVLAYLAGLTVLALAAALVAVIFFGLVRNAQVVLAALLTLTALALLFGNLREFRSR